MCIYYLIPSLIRLFGTTLRHIHNKHSIERTLAAGGYLGARYSSVQFFSILEYVQRMGDFNLLKEIPGYKAILKTVLKSQIQLLV